MAWYALLKAGLVPVATLAAHRGHEIAHISRAVGARAHLVEAGTRGIDLVEFAHEQAREHPTMRHVLVLGDLPRRRRRPRRGPSTRRGDPARHRPRRRRGLPALRRHHGGAEADPAPARRVLVQRPGLRRVPRLECRRPRRSPHPDHPQRRHRVRRPRPAQRRRVPRAHRPRPRARPCRSSSPSAPRSVLFGHVHYRAPEHPLYPALAGSLRTVVLSGAKVSEELFAATGRDGVAVGQLFGMAEGMFLVTPLDASPELRRTTVGTPISPLDEVRVLEPGSEDEVPDGEVGELCCRGPYTLRGYYGVDRPEAFTADGFYRTGDLAKATTIDGIRAFSIEGRIKDLINRGGEKINAEEVELLLLAHPHVVEAALVAMPDPRLGERGCAYLATDGTARHPRGPARPPPRPRRREVQVARARGAPGGPAADEGREARQEGHGRRHHRASGGPREPPPHRDDRPQLERHRGDRGPGAPGPPRERHVLLPRQPDADAHGVARGARRDERPARALRRRARRRRGRRPALRLPRRRDGAGRGGAPAGRGGGRRAARGARSAGRAGVERRRPGRGARRRRRPAGSRSSCPTCGRWPSRSSRTWRRRASRSSTGWRSRSATTPRSAASRATGCWAPPAGSTCPAPTPW